MTPSEPRDRPRIELASGFSLTPPGLTAVNQGLYTYYYIHFEEYPPEIADAERTGVQPLFEIYPPADLRETSHLERGWVQRVWPSSYGGHNARLAFHSNPLHEAVAEATLPLPQAPIPTPQASGGGRL